ncbi:MAG: hypothetical protein FJW95_08035 [Actinobacteria bacterium]|nr:hypothetical protein [Actinomycetota bacterium]
MRVRTMGLVMIVTSALIPVSLGGTAAAAKCASPMKAGTWSGPITQKVDVNGTASSGLTVTQQGATAGTLTLKVACNGKAAGTITDSTFDLDGSSGIAGINFPVRCRGTTGEVPVAGTVKKGAGGKPVIDITYGAAASQTFQCDPGPVGDFLNAQFATPEPGTTTPGAPTGLSLPATTATRATVAGTSFQATGGFDPIAISVQSWQSQGLTPMITQAWELTRG